MPWGAERMSLGKLSLVKVRDHVDRPPCKPTVVGRPSCSQTWAAQLLLSGSVMWPLGADRSGLPATGVEGARLALFRSWSGSVLAALAV
jgi:hypothetical protein